MPMNLSYDELGTREIDLSWIVLWRVFCMLAAPLVICLIFDHWVAEIIIWIMTAGLFWYMVGVWGHSVIAMGTVLLPLYIFCEIDSSPRWLAYLVGALFVWQVHFIKNRLKEIAVLRNIDDDLNRSDK
jgi:hypothetical protein